MFVAITKTAKDSKSQLHKGLPPEFPVECKEFETKEQAELECPGAKVMTVAQYRTYAEVFNLIFEHATTAKKPWFKFW